MKSLHYFSGTFPYVLAVTDGKLNVYCLPWRLRLKGVQHIALNSLTRRSISIDLPQGKFKLDSL